MVWCFHCSRDFRSTTDPKDGTICCGYCGRVQQLEFYAEEPTFVKGSGGESRLAGSFVKSTQSDCSESYRRTIEKGRRHIQEMEASLAINGATTLAEALYKIAVERGFTKGRRTDQVAAACLYIACREQKKHFLLIDFSSYLRINVYVLGAVFLQLCQLLSLQEHPIVQNPVDPSLFIGRYTNALVGGKALAGEYMKVNKTALNIIASMKRDWMQTGRKPSGLCGAAVYISALSHGFTCSKLDIVRAVHVCEATLTKRLVEFENTNSGSLTIEEFNKNAEVLKGEDHLSKLSDANSQNSDKMRCQHKDQKPHFAGMCESCCKEFIELSGGLHGGAEPPAFQRAERERLAKASSEKGKDPSFVLKPHQKESSREHINEMEVEHLTEVNQNFDESETANFTESASASASVGDQAAGDAADTFQKSNDVNGIADEPDSLSDVDVSAASEGDQATVDAADTFQKSNGVNGTAEELDRLSDFDVSAASEGDKATIDAADTFQKSSDVNGTAEELDSLSDIDDEEVNGYLNNEEECRYKKIIWEEMNKEYLQEQAEKEAAIAALNDISGGSDEMRSAQELAAATRAAVAKSREERRKKRASEAKNASAAQTAAEATRQMLTKKRLSSKINYDVLDKLFDEHPVPDGKKSRVESQHAGNVDGQLVAEERNKAYTNGDNDVQEQENEDGEEMAGEVVYTDEWYSRNGEEEFDYGYYDNDGDDEY